jgi:hypothetical protein
MLKSKKKAQLRALHSVLDLLETYNSTNQEHVIGSAPHLYGRLFVGALIRSMQANVDIPKSKRRAKALNIFVNASERPPTHERKLLRRRLSRRVRAVYDDYDEDDRDGELLV